MKHCRLCCLLAVWFVLGCVPAASGADAYYSVSGTIQFREARKIQVLLLNRSEFKSPEEASYKTTVTPNAAARAKGEAPFLLTDVPAGSYVLLAYQDDNDNGKLDLRFFNFSEPWGTFRPQRPGMGINMEFEDMVFDLTRDLQNITIRLTQ